MKREQVVRKGCKIVPYPEPTSSEQTSDYRQTRLLREVTCCLCSLSLSQVTGERLGI